MNCSAGMDSSHTAIERERVKASNRSAGQQRRWANCAAALPTLPTVPPVDTSSTPSNVPIAALFHGGLVPSRRVPSVLLAGPAATTPQNPTAHPVGQASRVPSVLRPSMPPPPPSQQVVPPSPAQATPAPPVPRPINVLPAARPPRSSLLPAGDPPVYPLELPPVPVAVRTPVQQLPIEVDSDSANDDDEGDLDEEDEYEGQEATRIGEFSISSNHPHASNYHSRQDETGASIHGRTQALY